MKHMLVLCCALIGAAGCRSAGPASAQAAPERVRPMTRDQFLAHMSRVAAGGEARAKAQQRAWMRDHADKVAEVNAQRAKSDLPPLGQIPMR